MREKRNCCGCRACEQICPKNCINMIEDDEGYLYPQIDRKNCINCGLCQKVCPMLNSNKIKNKTSGKYLKLISNDKEIIDKSSSGGAFSEITSTIVEVNQENKYKIYGCTLEENLKVKHTEIDNIKEIGIFRKSKYVQSDLSQIYSQVDKDLKENNVVVFTGTPCQIAGLKMFLKLKNNNNIDNLYTIDLICHGVPSYKVFSKYIEYLEKKYNSKVKKINFRERMKVANVVDSLGVKVEFQNNRNVKEFSFENIYMLGFFKGIYYRPCCEICPFASKERCSDITIGDFWGIKDIHKDLDDNKGISLCIVNSEKGDTIMEILAKKIDVTEENADIAIKNNNNLQKPSRFSPHREEFYEKLKDFDDFEKAIKHFIRKKSKLEFIIASNMNKNMKEKIKNILESRRN